MTLSWKSYVTILKTNPFRRNRARALRKRRRLGRILRLELLEDRTMLTVSAFLQNGVLDITLNAANDAATVSIVDPSTIRVFDGVATNYDFPLASVQSIDAAGNNSANQAVILDSAVTLPGPLIVTGVATITLNGAYALSSANLSATGTIAIAGGATLSSRHTAGGDPGTAPSTGDSGDLTLNAAAIAVGDGARVLANANNGFASGEITLTAAGSVNLNWFLGLPGFETLDASAGITIGAAILAGKDVRLTSQADTTKTLNLTATPPNPALAPVLNVLQNTILPFQVNADAVDAQASATVAIGAGASIRADRDVDLVAQASSTAAPTTTAIDLGVTYGSSAPTASATIAGSALVVAGGAFNLEADAINNLAVTAIVPSNNDPTLITFAYGHARSSATAAVQAGASVSAQQAAIRAKDTNSFSTQAIAQGFGQANAGVGAAVSIGDYQSTASATVGGTLTTTAGDAVIDAESVDSQDVTRSFASVLSPAASSGLLTNLQNYLVSFPLSTPVGASTIDPTGSGLKVAVAGAVVVEVGSNSAAAAVTSSGQVQSAGNLTVNSLAQDTPQVSATATAGDASQVSVGGAVSVAFFTNTADAIIDTGSIVGAGLALDVTANAIMPSPVTTFQPALDLGTNDTATGTDRVGERYQDGGTVGTRIANALLPLNLYLAPILGSASNTASSLVDARGTVSPSATAGVAGGVDLFSATNTADAHIAAGAKVNQGPGLAAATQQVNVQASATIQTVDLAGQPSALSYTGPGSGGVGVGGFFARVGYTNTAKAYIDDGAAVSAGGNVTVNATTSDYLLQLVQAGALNAGLGFDGAFSLADIVNQTLGYIQDGATIKAGGNVAVNAGNSGLILDLTGGLAQGAVVGVGVSASFTIVSNTTRAVIGDQNGTTGTPGSVTAGGDVTLNAQSSPAIWSAAVAGADAAGVRRGTGGQQAYQGRQYGYGVSGDVAFNLASDDTEAQLSDGVTVSAAHDVDLAAAHTSLLAAAAGGVVFGNSLGIGGSFAGNDATNTTKAQTQNVTLNAQDIGVNAMATNRFAAVSDGGAASKAGVAVAGSVNLNRLNNLVVAKLGDGTIATTTGDVRVAAVNTDRAVSDAGASSQLSNGYAAVGAAVDLGFYTDNVFATVGQANLQAAGNVLLSATNAANLTSISASLAKAAQQGVGADGAASSASLSHDVEASLAGTVATPQTIFVSALDNTHLTVSAGAEAAGAPVGVGLSAAISNISRTVKAFIGGGAVVSAGGNGAAVTDPLGGSFAGTGLFLHAETTDDLLAFAQGQATASDVGVDASAVVNTMTSDTEAFLGNATINGSNTGASTVQDVQARAEQTSAVLDVVGDFANAKTVGVGAAGDVEHLTRTVKAYVAPAATVNAQNNVVLAATSALNADAIVAGSAGAGDVSVQGSLGSLSFNTTTQAFIDQNAAVTAQNSVYLAADHSTTIATSIGASTFDGNLGIGFSNSSIFNTDVTQAFINTSAHVLAKGNGTAIVVLTGQRDAGGNELNSLLNGVSLTATSYENITPLSAGSSGQASPSTGVAASTTFTVLNETTQAFVASGASVNSSLAGAASGQVVNVLAADTTTVAGGAGTDASANNAGFGAGADVGSIVKDTEAFVSGSVNAAQNVLVQALSSEVLSSIAVTNEVDGAITIAAAGSVYTLNATTKAYVGDGATVLALGNLLISAIDADHLDLINDLSNSANRAAVGGALGIADVSKVTQAYVGNATVNALGNAPGIVANNGAFSTQFVPDSGAVGEVSSPGVRLGDNILNKLLGKTDVSSIPDDPALYQERTVTPQTQMVTGVAITAISADDIAHRTEGFGAVVVGTVQGSLAATVVSNLTSAFIGANARVNQGAGANADQGVLVAAGSDYFGLGISGLGSVAALATVGPAADTSLVSNQTTAYIGNSAAVSAQADVQVIATAAEYVVSFTGGFGVAAGVSLVPSLAVISLKPATLAYVDQNAVVNAQGNILVQARDDTHTDILAGSLGAGFLTSIGVTLGTTFVTKDTEAYVAAGATVNAKANGATGINVFSGDTSGTSFGTAVIHGLGVEAASSENLITTAGSGSAALIDVVGAASALIDSSTTKAHIDANARVNQDAIGANAAQTVNVSAVNSVNTLGTVANLSGSLLINLAGSVDLGVIRNNTLAYTGPGAAISALADIDVYALSAKLVQSQTGGAGVAIAGIDGSLSLYSVGAVLDQSSKDLLATGPAGNLEQFIDNAIQQFAFGASSGLATLLNAYAGALGDTTKAAATTINGAAPAGVLTAAVNSTTPAQGTAAYLDGSALSAGHDVNVKGKDNLKTVADTSFTYEIAITSAPLTLSIDAAVIATHGGAQAYALHGVDVVAAHDVNLLASSDNHDSVKATLAKNNLANTVAAYVDGSTLAAADSVNVNAASTEEATGNTSFLPGPVGLRVRLAQNTVADQVDAHITNGSTVGAGTALQVQASGGGSIKAIGIAVGVPVLGNPFVGIGAAASLNEITGAVTAYINQSRATAPSVAVAATSNPTITAITVGGTWSSGFSGDGSASKNTISQTIDAYLANGANVQAANSLSVTATDGASIIAVAGSGAGGGGVALGGSVSINHISDTVRAHVDNSTANSPTIQIRASAQPSIIAIAVGGQGATGVVAGGSAASNTVSETVGASLNGSQVSAATSLDLEANDGASIVSVAGNGEGATGVAIGGALSSNTITTNVMAQVNGGQVTAPTITFLAVTGEHITSIAVSGGGAVGVAAGGSDSSNTIGGTIQAAITGGAAVTVTSPLDLEARDDGAIVSVAGNGQGATGVAVGAAASTNTINPTVQAQVSSSQVRAPALTLHAEIGAHITSVAAAGGGATGVAAGGGLSRNDINPMVQAQISGGQVTAATISLLAETGDNIISVAAGGGGAIGVAADGADSANTVGGTIAAFSSGATVNATTSLSLEAHDGATVLSVAGNGEGGVGVSLGASISQNTVTPAVQAEISGGQVTTPTATLHAISDAGITSIAVGGAGATGVAANGSDSTNSIGGSIMASIDSNATVTTTSSLDLEAHENATIVLVAGNGQGAVGVAVGGALSQNTINPAVQAEIMGAQASGPAVTLVADTMAHITSLAVSGSGGIGVAGGGSDSTNTISETILAAVSGGAVVTASGTLTLTAHDGATILSVAGNGEGAVGVALGGAISQNTINPTIEAQISGARATAPVAGLVATSDGNITAIAVGGAGAVGVAANGSDSANNIGGSIVASIDSNATVTTTTSLDLEAHDNATIALVAGNGQGAVGVAVGGALAQNTINPVVQTEITGAQASGPAISLLAETKAHITSIAVSGGGAVGVAGGGSDVTNSIDDTILAAISGGAVVTASGTLTLTTHDGATILSVAGNGQGAVGVAFGGAFSQNNLNPTIEAQISGAQTTAPVVSLVATSDGNITAIAVGGAGAVGVAANGSDSVNNIGGSIVASIDSNATVSTTSSLDLEAHENAQIFLFAGNGAGAVGAAVGVAIADNTVNPTVQAQISGSQVSASTASVLATAGAQISSTAIGGAGAVGVAAGASIVDNEIGSSVDAHVSNGSVVSAANGLTISATDASSISAIGGAAGGAVGAGAGVATTTDGIHNLVTAYVDASTVTSSAGSLVVAANSTPSITSFGIAGGGALGLGVAASVANATISTTTDAHLSGGANVNAAGSISVEAQFTPSTSIVAGGISGGIVGVGASDVEANLASNTNASAQTGAVLAAGGSVTVGAGSNVNSWTVNSFVGTGGIVALNAAVAHVSSANNASASIASGAAINSATSVTVSAETSSNPIAHAYGIVGGIVAVGGTDSNASETGTTRASVDDGTIGGSSPGQQVGSVTVTAMTSQSAEADSFAAAGGIGAANSNNATADAKPTVQAAIDNGTHVQVSRDIGQMALALGGAAADSEGVGGGVLHVGTSKAEASWQPTVEAVVGGGTTLTAGGNLNLQAFNNYDASGNPDSSRTVQATANASGGGAVDLEGAEADPSTNSNVKAHVGAGASLSAGNSLNVVARSLDNLQGSAGGGSGGIFAKGSSVVNAFMTSQTLAVTDAASASAPTVLRAGTSLTFMSDSNNVSSVHASGGAGGVVGLGAAQATVQLSSPVSLAGLGDNTTVNAPSAAMQILALSTTNLQASTDQSTIGAIADNESDATAQVSGGQTTADVGAGVSINVHSYSQIADNTSVQVSATSNASVGDLAGSNTANSNADATTNARVHFGSGSSIISATFVNLIAATDTANTSSHATTTTTGLTGSLFSNAGSNKFINTEVDSDPGSHITAQTLTVIAQRAPTDPSTYVKDPQTNANTVAELVAVAVHTVCEVIGQVVCLWGAFCNPDTVCNTITDFVREILGAEKSATSPGSESVTNSVNFNSDVTITGIVNHTFVVDRSGRVLQEDNVTATDGTNPLSVGQTATTGKIVVSETVGTSSGQVLIEAAGGSTSGSSHIEFDTFGNITIHNDSANDLYVNNLDVINSSNPPAVTHIADMGQDNWTYTLSSNAAGGAVDIRNTDPTNNAIVLLGNILNPIGLTLIHNSGGDILASGPGSFVRTRLADLESDHGTLGTANQRIPLQLVVSMGLSSAIEQAQGYNGVYLDVVAAGMMVPLAFSVNNVGSAAGNVDVKIEDGQEMTTVAEEVVMLSNGTTIQGIVLMNTGFNPATAVNGAAGIINLGYTHSLSIGEEVTYFANGGAPIGGLVDGGLYRVKVVDSTSVQLGDTFTPATAVNPATGTINFGYSHDFQNGTKIIYDNGGGTSIPGLVNGQAYYVRVIDGTTIKLAATPAEATATPFFFDPSTAVDSTANTINFGVADGFTTGQAVTYRAHGVPIQGLVDGDTYYVIVVNSTTIQLAATLANATAATPVAIALNAASATGRQSIGDEGIPLGASTDATTQFLRIALDPSTATGTDHQLVTDSFYLQVGPNLIRVQNADVTNRSFLLVPTLTPEDTTVVVQNISAPAGNVTIAAGTTTQAHDNLVLTGMISSPAGTTTLSTFAGSISNGDPGHVVSARDVVLSAPGGTIGAAGAPIQTIIGAGHLNATAKGDVYVTEVAGALPVGVVTSAVGNVVLTVPISAPSGNDLRMDPTSSISAGGSVTLLVADNVSIAKGSTITGGAPVLIKGDYGKSGPGAGSTITVAGVIYAPFATILGGDENDTINLTNVAANTITLVNTGGGVNVVNLGSVAPLTGGVIGLIQGPLTVQGSGADTMNVDDTGDTAPQSGTLSGTRLTGLGMGPSGIAYSGLTALNINLGSGGNSFNINVDSVHDLPATTTINGGSSNNNSLLAFFAQDFNNTLNLFGFQMATITVTRDFNGTMSDTAPGAIQQLAIGRSLTASGKLIAGSIGTMSVGQDIAGTVQVFGNVGTATIGGSVSGLIQVGGNFNILSVGVDVSGSILVTGSLNQTTIGGSVTVTGVIKAAAMTTMSVGVDVAGLIAAVGNIGTLAVGHSVTYQGIIQAGGNLNTMTVGPDMLVPGDDMAGQIVVGGMLGSLRVAGGTPGDITAGHVGTVRAYGAYGPYVLQILENGIQRRVEMAVPSNPYPLLHNPPQPPIDSPAGVTIQYFYESAGFANPQWTARVTNAAGTAPDQYDLSLVTYNDAAKFNLVRLDAAGVAGIRNVAIEGDILTSVSTQAASFFPGDTTAAGIRLPKDHVAGVGVRDFLPAHFIQAASIEALAFGSFISLGILETGAMAHGSDAAKLLAAGTKIVQAADTFRVPFADLPTQQVGLFLATAPGGGSFDNHSIILVVQGVSSPNAAGTANIVTPSNVARGAVTALVTVAPTYSSLGLLQNSVVQSIALRGDGGSIKTQQYISGSITSTGPLGDLILRASQGVTNITAPSMFGSLLATGPITGTVQTTGLRTDPITGVISVVAADMGRLYVNTSGTVPVITTTKVQASGGGITGRLISRGDLISQVTVNGGLSGLVAVQGNIGKIFVYPSGKSIRLGGFLVVNGGLSGDLVTTGTVIGDLGVINGGLTGRIAAKGGIIGNLTINGGLGTTGALVSGGEIGDATLGTKLLIINGSNNGIIAAKGVINFGKTPPTGAVYNDVGATPGNPNAAAIDAIFTDHGLPLAFDITGLDLQGLALILTDLQALHVGPNGILTGPIP